MTQTKVPNPGSDEAIEQGCICPVLDNGHGMGRGKSPDGKTVFWITRDCPLHDPPELLYNITDA